MALHVCKHSDVTRIFGSDGLMVMDMYGFTPTVSHYHCSQYTDHDTQLHGPYPHTTYTTQYAQYPHTLQQKSYSMTQVFADDFDSSQFHDMRVQKFPHAVSAPATTTVAPLELSVNAPAVSDEIKNNIAVEPSLQVPQPQQPMQVQQQPEDFDEIPADVIEASRLSVLADEVQRSRRDSEFQSKYIHDMEIALQESVRMIVDTVSRVAGTVVDSISECSNVAAPTVKPATKPTVELAVEPAVEPATKPTVDVYTVVVSSQKPNENSQVYSQQQNILECMICFDDAPSAVNTVFIPCGHTCCAKCACAVEVCPKCNTPITSRNRFFL